MAKMETAAANQSAPQKDWEGDSIMVIVPLEAAFAEADAGATPPSSPPPPRLRFFFFFLMLLILSVSERPGTNVDPLKVSDVSVKLVSSPGNK